MRSIYKYVVPGPGLQNDVSAFWADVDTQGAIGKRQIVCANTGAPTPDGRFVGTVTVEPAGIVWHVFDQGSVWL